MRGGRQAVAGAGLLVLAGCGARSGPEVASHMVGASGAANGGAFGASGGRNAAGGAGSAGLGGEASPEPCVAKDLGASLGAPVAEGVLAGPSAHASPCGGSGPEARYRVRAPISGFFRFDTRGSGTPTVLSSATSPCAADAECVPGEVGLGPVHLDAGQSIDIIVDTDGTGGGYVLNALGPVEPDVPCPGPDLGTRLGPSLWVERLAGPLLQVQLGCTSTVGAAVAQWTAPYEGSFAFDTVGSSFDTAIEVRSGECPGVPLSCSDSAGGAASRARVSLVSGQRVLVLIAASAIGSGISPSLDHLVLNVTEAPSG
jgi:hypothetical protein